MAYIEKKVLSSDGYHRLAGRVFLPKGEIRGIFQVAHGMTEHLGRYERFMERLAEEGYLACGYDHIGHGNTATSEEELGYFAKKNGWRLLCRDIATFAEAIRNEYGKNLPYILMGHSMGSFIARLAARHYCRPDALIVMGTAGPNPASGMGIALSSALCALSGERKRAGFLRSLAFGSYNKRFADENDSKSWLTKDEEIRRIYKEDAFCNFYFTNSGMRDLMTLLHKSNSTDWFTKIDKSLPILLVSGADDPVGGFGKGVKAVYNKLKSAGANVTLKLYKECRHEILNDTCRDEVITDILVFIKDM